MDHPEKMYWLVRPPDIRCTQRGHTIWVSLTARLERQ
jgi:hypothetical protein